jgi:hypothetical protein
MLAARMRQRSGEQIKLDNNVRESRPYRQRSRFLDGSKEWRD